MCGIIAAFNHGDNKSDVNDWVKYQLQDQISRGKEGFGIVFIEDDGSYKVERSTELTKVHFDLYTNRSKMIFLHHRTPTSSANKIKQTHPILVNDGSLKNKYLVIHNGIISNDDELKKKHTEELGFVYTTDADTEYNDSEALAIEAARFIEGQTDKIEAIGSAAFIALEINKKSDKIKKVHFCRNSNPLKLSQTRGKLRLSSEGEGEEIKQDTLYSFNLKEFKLSKKECVLQSYKPATDTKQTTMYLNTSKGYSTTRSYNYYDDPYLDLELLPTEKIRDSVIDKVGELMEGLIDEIIQTLKVEDDTALPGYVDLCMDEIGEAIKTSLPEFSKAVQEEIIQDERYGRLPNKRGDIKEPEGLPIQSIATSGS